MARKCSVSYGNGLLDVQYYIQSNEKEITVRHSIDSCKQDILSITLKGCCSLNMWLDYLTILNNPL